MFPNPSFNFLLDIGLLIGIGIHLFQVLLYRSRRKDIMIRYKPGTLEHEAYSRILSNRRLLIVLVAFISVIAKIGYDIHATIGAYGPRAYDQLIFMTLLGLAAGSVISCIVYTALKGQK